MKTDKKLWIYIFAALCGVLTASAEQVININIDSSWGSPPVESAMDGTVWSPTAAPASYTGNTWNDMEALGTWYLIRDSEGNDTSIRLDTTSTNARIWSADAGLDAIKGYRYHTINDQQYELSGLGANTEWDVYILSHAETIGEAATWTVGSEIKTVGAEDSQNLQDWQSGKNYVKFSSVSADASGEISMEVDIYGTANYSIFNGMQLVAVPEPSVAVFAGLFSTLVFIRKRFFF